MPDAAQDFAYTTTGTGGGTLFASGTFLLDDDADGTLPASRTFTFTGADATGTKTITETLPVAGWTLTNLVCTGGGANTTHRSPPAVASIGLDPGEAVTCTYTNTRTATITVVKDAVPDDAQDFAYTTTGTGGGTFGSGFSLDDDADATLPNSRTFTFTGADATGTKTITETLPVTGWTLTNLVCSKGTTTLATGLASIALVPGDAVTCTYTNTQHAHDHGHQGRRARRRPGLRLHDDRHRRRDLRAASASTTTPTARSRTP